MRLPTYQELSKEQLEIYNLPLDDTYLVAGPPGTGKTVMALYRAQMYDDSDTESKVIMYNNTLEEYTSDASLELEISGQVSTFNRWFWYGYPDWTGEGYPPEKRKFVYEWKPIISTLVQKSPRNTGALLIDEGQDLPPGFYVSLPYIANKYTIFADENQRLDEERNSTLDIIRDSTDPDDELLLTTNYRNTREIARLAREFYVGLESGKPDLPDRRGDKPVVRRTESSTEAARFIANHERTNDHERIGVLVKHTDTQLEIYRMLRSIETENEVQLYSSSNEAANYIDFSVPGLQVLCFASAKGLEFDTVFLPEIQRYTSEIEQAETWMKLYVMISRARDQLYVMYSGDDEPPILELFPDELVEMRN
jgi:DNA helicase IV